MKLAITLATLLAVGGLTARLPAVGGLWAGPGGMPNVTVTDTENPLLQDYKITGIEAWSTARQHGFQFRPVARNSTEKVTEPYDGVNTQLLAATSLFEGNLRASVVGGNAVVQKPGSGTRTRTIRFFWGRHLADGWRVQEISIGGTRWSYSREPGWGTADIPFSLNVTANSTSAGSAYVTSMTLRGPRRSDWTRAFRRN